MLIRDSLGKKVTVLILVGAGLVLGAVLGFSYYNSHEIVLNEANANASSKASSEARRIELELRAVAEITETMASAIEQAPMDEHTLLAFIKHQVASQKEIFGSCAAFEPFAFRKDLKAFCPYYRKGKGKDKDEVDFVQLGTETYIYFNMDWYSRPKELKTRWWSPPYFDEGGGNIIMTTFSHPFFHLSPEGARGDFKGVVTADISISWLTERLKSIKVRKTGFCFLISDTGTFVAYPREELTMKESIFSLAEKRGAQALSDAGHKMLGETEGFVHIGTSLTGKDSLLAFARLPDTKWSLGMVFPEDELYSEIRSLNKQNAALGVAGLFLLLGVGLAIAASVTRPLRRIVEATEKVAHGDLDVDLSAVRSHDEVGRLAHAFVHMTVDLKRHIEELTRATRARERLESELAIAAGIQRSMLPTVFPAFPDHNELDIYAVMLPAKEVGGDLYNFFAIDEQRICLALGDVSGKGVPAALFMAVTSFLLRAAAALSSGPDEILQLLNKQLSRDNPNCMFVTVFCGVLNCATGELLYSNGGHPPPLVVRLRDGISPLERPQGPVLGVIEGASFGLDRMVLQPGDALVAYSDGVTEAFNNSGEEFSEARLKDRLIQLRGKPVSELVQGVILAVDEFSAGRPRDDDTTILAVTFNGKARS